MHRRLLLVVTLLVACHSHGCPRRQAAPPSILLISIDTLRADRLNCYGYQRRRVSPNLDALSRESVLFEQHITASPWTTPSHLSLFTSLRPTAHGVTQPFGEFAKNVNGRGRVPSLAESVPTLPELMHANGWTTAAFTGGVTLDPRIGFGRGFELYDVSMYKLRPKNMDRMIEWITNHRHRSMFLFWHSFEVHAPYLSGAFLEDVMERDSAHRLTRALRRLARDCEHSSIYKLHRLLKRRDVLTADVTDALYDGGILSMDRWIGQVLAYLRDLGLYDDMMIIVTSDHGEQLGERDGLFFNIHGHSLYEEMIRVPLIVKLPGQAFGGRRVTAVTRSIDVMPTILDLACVSTSGLSLQGASLRSFWDSGNEPADRWVLSEATTTRYEMKSLRSRRHKYIVKIAPKDVQERGRSHIPQIPESVSLFDLESDPEEADNLLPALDADASQLAQTFDGELRSRVVERTAHADTHAADDEILDSLRALGYID
ncbi:MAG: sulfatase [Vicinamibacteria bacterium]|nr:sulfatase [Vicinamibacteria bacterium]